LADRGPPVLARLQHYAVGHRARIEGALDLTGDLIDAIDVTPQSKGVLAEASSSGLRLEGVKAEGVVDPLDARIDQLLLVIGPLRHGQNDT
jgi:hypothetical protein